MSGAVDVHVLADLAIQLGDAGPPLVRELVDAFLIEAPDAFAALAAAVTSRIADVVRQRAHRLRGQALALGLTELAVELRAVEASAKSEHCDGSEDALPRAMCAWNRARPWLESRR